VKQNRLRKTEKNLMVLKGIPTTIYYVLKNIVSYIGISSTCGLITADDV